MGDWAAALMEGLLFWAWIGVKWVLVILVLCVVGRVLGRI